MAKLKCINRQPTDEKHEKNIALIERYRVISDESGHDYVIPVYKTKEFEAWVRATEDGDNSNYDFDDCRIDGGVLTFTDPKVG